MGRFVCSHGADHIEQIRGIRKAPVVLSVSRDVGRQGLTMAIRGAGMSDHSGTSPDSISWMQWVLRVRPSIDGPVSLLGPDGLFF